MVTGGGNGLGQALATAFAARGARVTVVDVDGDAALATARRIGGLAVEADVGHRAELDGAVQAARRQGPVDLWCSNAALSAAGDLLDVDDAAWEDAWHVNVTSHLWAAKALLPICDRGDGYLFQTVSAAALTLNHYDAVYSTTKRAALALGEYLSVTYGPAGVKVSCFCPRGMLTDRLRGAASRSPAARNALPTAITPEEAAAVALMGIEQGRFLILTEEEEVESHRVKAADLDTWLDRRRRQRLDELGD